MSQELRCSQASSLPGPLCRAALGYCHVVPSGCAHQGWPGAAAGLLSCFGQDHCLPPRDHVRAPQSSRPWMAEGADFRARPVRPTRALGALPFRPECCPDCPGQDCHHCSAQPSILGPPDPVEDSKAEVAERGGPAAPHGAFLEPRHQCPLPASDALGAEGSGQGPQPGLQCFSGVRVQGRPPTAALPVLWEAPQRTTRTHENGWPSVALGCL